MVMHDAWSTAGRGAHAERVASARAPWVRVEFFRTRSAEAETESTKKSGRHCQLITNSAQLFWQSGKENARTREFPYPKWEKKPSAGGKSTGQWELLQSRFVQLTMPATGFYEEQCVSIRIDNV